MPETPPAPVKTATRSVKAATPVKASAPSIEAAAPAARPRARKATVAATAPVVEDAAAATAPAVEDAAAATRTRRVPKKAPAAEPPAIPAEAPAAPATAAAPKASMPRARRTRAAAGGAAARIAAASAEAVGSEAPGVVPAPPPEAPTPAPAFPTLLPPRPDPVLNVVGPAAGAVEARPVDPAALKPAPLPSQDGDRFPWLPLGLILLVAVLLVGAIVLAIRTIASTSSSLNAHLPGVPPLPGWAWLAAVVVLGVLVWGAYALVNRPLSDDEQGERRGWRALLDSRIIGTALSAMFLLAAVLVINTPGYTPDIRELPGEVSGAIQSVVARPEPGYPRIRIKKVGIDLLLVKGDGKTPPVKYEAFTYPNADHLLADSSTPGNSYVYAHARDGMFWNLHNLSIGDVVEIDYGGGKIYRYRVSELHRSVSWKDFSWLQPTSDDRLTLQTCNGWRDDDPRFIVVAHRIPDTSTALAK